MSIDRISINRPEPEQAIGEQHKLNERRRRQSIRQGGASPSLSSIEAQSQLLARTLQGERKRNNNASQPQASFDGSLEGDLATHADLNALAGHAAKAAIATPTDAAPLPVEPRFIARRQWTRDGPGAGQSQVGAPARAPGENFTQPRLAPAQHAHAGKDKREQARGGSVPAPERRPAQRAASLSGTGVLTADAGAAASLKQPAAVLPITDRLDDILHKVQALATEATPVAGDVMSALNALKEAGAGTLPMALSASDAAHIDGSYRFLGAFIETMGQSDAHRTEMLSAVDASRAMLLGEPAGAAAPGTLPDQPALPSARLDGDKAQDSAVAGASTDKQEDVPPLQDRQTLYAYLELLSATAAGNAAMAPRQLAEMRRLRPEAALQRLAAAGDSSVSLYTDEISRRLQDASVRLGERAEPGARPGMLQEAFGTEKRTMLAAIASAENGSDYAAAHRYAEQREQERRANATVPLVVLQKA
jgi:hypothetical protein